MHSVVINTRSLIYDNNKNYPQIFLDECLYGMAE